MSFVLSTIHKIFTKRNSYSIRFIIFRKMTFVFSTIQENGKSGFRIEYDFENGLCRHPEFISGSTFFIDSESKRARQRKCSSSE